jgi:hypothetical protein
MKINDFRPGDSVKHMSGAEGRVLKVTDAVTVEFDGYRGEYDHVWFRMHPEGLKIIQQTPGA